MAQHFDPNYYLKENEINELLNNIMIDYKQKVQEFKSISTFKYNGKGRKRKSCNVTLQAYYLVQVLYLSGKREVEVIGNKKEKRLPGLHIDHINFEDKTITYFLGKKNQVSKYVKKKEEKENGDIIIKYKKLSFDDLVSTKKNKQEYKQVLPLTPKLEKVLNEYINKFNIEDKLFTIARSTFDKILKKAYERSNFTMIGNKKTRYVESAEPIFKEINGKKTLVTHKYNFFYRVLNKRIGAHIFRHSFAFNFLDKNKNDETALEKLRRILDHGDFNITKNYAHFTNEDMRNSLEKF